MAAAPKKLIVIIGPTASGKTDLAIQLAQGLNGAVVSADSRQVYAGMNIGTAKPEFAWHTSAHDALASDAAGPASPAPPAGGTVAPAAGGPPSRHPQLGSVSHYLFNIRQPNNPLSLAEWQAAAFSGIDHLHQQGRTPFLVGGTMLYIDSIVKNYNLPDVPPNLSFRQTKEQQTVEDLYGELLAKDPAAQAFIEPRNKRRIIRALEVMAATTRSFSELRQQRPSPYDITIIGLFDSWAALEERITKRLSAMLADGLLEETQRLVDTYGAHLPLLQTLNYTQALALLSGRMSEQEALDDMRRANMRYAHRQMSWWKDRKDIHWFEKPENSAIKDYLAQLFL